ncbi:hypothetical protein HMPREF0262_02995 [Clostridium sp. ATCC 29733]|nr:hypothetical protein HMPREF0262_02995 [Clostridium sp. ATCC 29733]
MTPLCRRGGFGRPVWSRLGIGGEGVVTKPQSDAVFGQHFPSDFLRK